MSSPFGKDAGGPKQVEKVVVSVNGKTYQYDPSGSCETPTHLGPLQPFPNGNGFDFKDLAILDSTNEYSGSLRAHYTSSTDPTKQVGHIMGRLSGQVRQIKKTRTVKSRNSRVLIHRVLSRRM
jgi:hypothetical protein